MKMNEYQKIARKTAIYPSIGNNLTYPILGLCGEVGEIANKFKKVIRDNNGILSDEVKYQLFDELGDVLWYVSNVANELNVDLEDVADKNLLKLHSRKLRGVISGSGDKR